MTALSDILQSATPPFFAGLGLIITGILIILYHFAVRRQKEKMRQWTACSGILHKVEKTGLGVKVIGTGDYRRYILSVQYRYTVNGKDYTGTRINFGSDITVAAEVNEFCDAHKEGQTVNIYYNPEKPQESVLLQQRPGNKPNRELYFGFILIGLGLLMAYLTAPQ